MKKSLKKPIKKLNHKSNKYKKTMKKIIIDTNFLLIPFQFRIDIFSEIDRIVDFKYELFIVDKTIDELKKIIKEQKGKNKEAAKIALALIKNKRIRKLKTDEELDVDSLLLKQKEAIIATQDVILKRRLKKNKIKTITLRQKKYLMLN